MKEIVILALNGVFDSSLSITLNALSSAQRIHQVYCDGVVATQVTTCSPHGLKLKTGEGLSFEVHKSLEQVSSADLVIVPGLGIEDSLSLEQLFASQGAHKAIAFLQSMHQQGAILTASCSATFLLAEAGILDGHSVTTSWWLSETFRARYPQLTLQTDQMVVSGKQFICAGAAMAQADLMMIVIASIYGEQTAKLTADYLLIDQRHLQSQYIHSSIVARLNPLIAEAELWVRNNLKNNFSINDLASVLGVSTRTLARRFIEATGEPAVKFIQRIRVEYVIHYLETSHKSFEEIASHVGYQDVSSLRRVLYQITGKTPRQLRAFKP